MKLPNKNSIKYHELSIKYGKSFAAFLIITILATGYLILNTAPALAQETQRSVTLTYPSLIHVLNPGGRSEGITKITNQSNEPLTFSLNVQDFVVTDTLGTPNFLPPNTLSNKYSAAAWIGVTPNTFTLQPGHEQTINYYIQVPPDARPGGHYAAIVYTPVVTKGVTGSGSTVNSELGSIFYVTVNGPITEKSLVSKFFTNPFSEYGPVKILTQIRNLGDLHISPKATINVSGLFYNQSKDLDTHNIFPEAARDFETTLGQTFMIGRYRAIFMGSYGVNNNLPLVASVYFWVFPWRITLIIVFAIIALILGALYLKKRTKRTPKDPTKTETEPVATVPPTGVV